MRFDKRAIDTVPGRWRFRKAAEEGARSSFDEATESVAKRTGIDVPKRLAEELTVRAFDVESRQPHERGLDGDRGG